mgnify:CR=1 FL=1
MTTSRPELKEILPRLPVGNLSAVIDFYVKVIGFEVDMTWPEEAPTFAILARGPVRIAFFGEDEHRKITATGNIEVVLETSDAKAELAAVTAAGIEIEWGPEVYFYGRREFAFRDPEGNLIIFSEPTEDTPDSEDA